MLNIEDWDSELKKWMATYIKNGCEIEYTSYVKKDKATPEEIAKVEKRLGAKLPSSYKKVMLEFSKSICFKGFLLDKCEFPNELKDVFNAQLDYDIDKIVEIEEERKKWEEEVFYNLSEEYDMVWHNKLAFMEVPNGDCIAFDLEYEGDDKPVIYLSHEDGEGHGYILGRNFEEFLGNYIEIGCCGPEDWQMIPFIPDATKGIDPNCKNAKTYREILGKDN